MKRKLYLIFSLVIKHLQNFEHFVYQFPIFKKRNALFQFKHAEKKLKQSIYL